jgi:hypothetical protein
MYPPSRAMKAEAATAGFYVSPWGKHLRLQIFTTDIIRGVDGARTRGLRRDRLAFLQQRPRMSLQRERNGQTQKLEARDHRVCSNPRFRTTQDFNDLDGVGGGASGGVSFAVTCQSFACFPAALRVWTARCSSRLQRVEIRGCRSQAGVAEKLARRARTTRGPMQYRPYFAALRSTTSKLNDPGSSGPRPRPFAGAGPNLAAAM